MISTYIFICILLIILEMLYLKIALVKNIKDKPNHRSAHTKPTIRGGGIIVILSIFLYACFFSIDTEFIPFMIAVTIVSVVSFVDDLIMLSSKIRMLFHLIAFTILFYQLGLLVATPVISIAIAIGLYIFSIGFLNIYNFMDGINGITFLNAIVTFGTLLYLNEEYIVFTDTKLLITLIIAMFIFGFFNFRKKAICFAGDIGSIAIGFSILYFLIKLYLASQNPLIIFILFVYLVDGGWTIVQRLLKKENIFEAHKQHLYQLLANDLKISQLAISGFYFIFQLIINGLLIIFIKNDLINYFVLITVFLSVSLLYFFIKYTVLKKIKRESGEA